MTPTQASHQVPQFVSDWIAAEQAAGRDGKGRVVVAQADAASERTKVTVYGPIGYWGVRADRFAEAIDDIDGDMELRVNSPGGDAFAGIAMMNRLHDFDGHVRAHVDGLAASAASLLIMGADERVMERGSQIMIHEAGMIAWGNKRGMRKADQILTALDEDIADLYAEVGNGTAKHYMAAMEEETWYRAKAAIKEGLADRKAGKAKSDDDGDGGDTDGADAMVRAAMLRERRRRESELLLLEEI